MASAPVVRDEQAPALQSASAQPIPEPASLLVPTQPRALLGVLGSAVIPATVALYVLGFVVSVPHYLRCGVPISALSPQTYVAAGILFAALVSAPFALGTLLVRKQRNPWRLLLDAVGIIAAIGCLYLYVGVPLPYGQGYVDYVILVLYGWPETTLSALRSDPVGAAWRLVRMGAVVVGIPVTFAQYIYPVVPAQYGGGRPESLLSVSLGPSHEWPPSHDRWALTRCRTSAPLSGPERCRTVFRVHESQEHLYVGIREVPGVCPSTPPAWDVWPFADKQRVECFQRIANSQVLRLETPGKP
jgi:hypothetical protein